VALLSPPYEMKEYLMTYLNIFDLAIFLYLILGLYLLYILFVKFKYKSKIIRMISSILLLIIILILNYLHLSKSIRPYVYIEVIREANSWKEIVEKRNSYLVRVKSTIKNINLLYDKIVVIIGESANRHHMSIYGYDIPTTPFLSSLLESNNSVIFKNIIAPTNQTRYSIPIELTNATVEKFQDFIKSKSIVSVLKEYGYKTYWISNQFATGRHDTYITSIANEADYSIFMNLSYDVDKADNIKYDMILVDYLNKMGIDENSKEFYIFHLMGSHVSYDNRYPNENALFPDAKNVIEKYDNTIYYTDYVISKIYERFKNEKLLFIYISDHSEIINLKEHGHGHLPTYKDEYDIPLIIYSTTSNKRLKTLQKECENILLNAESFNHIVNYLVGIEDDYTKISHSSKIFALEPKNVMDYKKLKTYEETLNKDNKNGE
jgi:heptose-I-phosphate ethanolaminephosphotransferase